MFRRGFALCLLATLTLTGCIQVLSSREKVALNFRDVPFGAERTEKVYFDADKFDLKGNGKKIILNLVEQMKKDKSMMLVVTGHTDSVGTEDYNMALGERRANAVKQFILGCDRSLAPRVTVKSKGEMEPEVLVYSSDPVEVEKAHAQNRRAVIAVSFLKPNTTKGDVASLVQGVGESARSGDKVSDNSKEGSQSDVAAAGGNNGKVAK